MKSKISNHEAPGITGILNQTASIIRWCTPSVDLTAPRVISSYESDISVSYMSLGFPNEPSGIFEDAYKRAARAYGADHTLFSVNGSTGSNFMIMRALSKQIPKVKILAQRNIHKSILAACEDYNINLIFLAPKIDQRHHIFLPNAVDEFIRKIERSKPHVLLITNPTYEGVVLDLKELISTVRKQFPELIIFVEEAWGAHLHFSEKLPTSAMKAGADICVQSTHKQGGALQQTSMIHWKNGRVNKDIMYQSYKALMTTSPSYSLLASLDAARESMEKYGKEKIDYLLKIAEELSRGIDSITGLKTIKTKQLKERNPSVFNRDETKVLVEVTDSGFTGFQIAEFLEKEYSIIVEKCEMRSILFLVPFQASFENVKKTVDALRNIVRHEKVKPDSKAQLQIKLPKRIVKKMDINRVAKLDPASIEKVALERALGRISAENISLYPPGIPSTIKGEMFTGASIEYYTALRRQPHCRIVAADEYLDTVLVVKQ